MYNSYVAAESAAKVGKVGQQSLSSTSSAVATSTRMVRPVVVSGPSGGGKSTILKRAFEDYPDAFGFSVSREFFAFLRVREMQPRPQHPTKPDRYLYRIKITNYDYLLVCDNNTDQVTCLFSDFFAAKVFYKRRLC